MKRFNKFLMVVLVMTMILPMCASFLPLGVGAETSSAGHIVYQNKFDFEDAVVGEKLTSDYLNKKVDGAFTTTVQSGVDTNDAGQRNPSSYTVMSETVGDVTNKYIQPNVRAAMPTIYDQTGLIWRQPYEISFKIKGEKGSYLAESAAASGYNYGALIAVSTTLKATASSTRQSLLYARDLTINWGANGTNNICKLVSNQWHQITALIDPLTGVIQLRIEQLTFDENGTTMTVGSKGTASSDNKVITSTVTVSALATNAAAAPTEGLLSLGRFYGDAAVDFCFDDISLGSYIDEHIDFTDAVITEKVDVQALAAYLSENGGSMTTGVAQFTDAAGTDCYDFVQVGDEWYLNQDVAVTAKANATEAAITFKDATNLSGDETLEIVFDFHKNSDGLSNAYNVIRLKGGSTVAPLTFRQGKYITTNANGYAILRKTESGYKQGLLAQNTWYSFKTVIDLSTGKFNVYINEGRTTDANGDPVWEPLYFFKNGTVDGQSGGTVLEGSAIAENTYGLTEYADIMTTDGDLAWYNSSVSFTKPTLYLMHGTNDAWGSREVNAYMDNLSIKTADGNINVSMDFTPEITVTEQNVDWWENDTFQNADAKKGGAKLSDWQVVDSPVANDGRGSVIQPTGTLGSFCFNDTKNLLPSYVFDVSFDFYMTEQPSSNIHLLKLWAPYTATDGGASATLSTLVLYNKQFMVYDDTVSSGRKSADVVVAADPNVWYNIRVRFDFANGRYMAYINDQLIHTQNILEVYPSMNLDDLQNLHFAIHNHWGSSVKGYHYLDNIKVRTVEKITSKNETAQIIGVQQSKNSNSIRVIAGVNSLNYGNVGFTFELLSSDGTGWVKVHDEMTNTVFTQITADGETVKAAEEGCRYFIVAVISNIDSDGILCIRPYTTKNCVRNYGEEAVYSLKVDDGSLLTQKTTIANTSSSDYVVYKQESYEDAKEKFSLYNATPDVNDTNEYRLGGQMLSTTIPVGATTESARTGEKALTIKGIAPTSAGAYSARIKLNNLMPFDIENYINYDVKISAYVRLTDYVDSSKTVALRFGLMSDKGYTELSYKTYHITEGEWTFIEYEGRITQETITALGEGYPARVFLGLGNGSSYASTIYMDDVKVEFKPSVGVTLPSIFADGMVLQRNKPVNVWGWDGLKGDTITATVTDKSGATVATASTTVTSTGDFEITLPAMAGGAGHTLTVVNENTGSSVAYTNVGIGEVWYCSGQSNMQLAVGKVHNVEDIIADASNRDIRSFKMSIASKYTLQKDVSNGSWKQVTSDNVTGVSAIGYITAYMLQKQLGVPVAIIESYNGGSAANPWLSYDKIFANDRADVYNNEDWIPTNADGSLVLNSSGCEGRTIWEDYEYYWQVGTSSEGTLQAGTQGSIGNRFAPAGLYNGMQGPLAGYAIAGVMWYQGESRANSLKTEQYNYILNDLIEQWREDFRDEDLPVVIFQLAPYSDYYNLIRQVQLDTAKRINNVYAITTAYEGAIYSAATGGYCLDLDRSMSNGWGNGIHPGTKRPVAERAAYAILVGEYGLTDAYAAYLNPEYQSMTVEGNVATLTFTNADGLKVRDGDSSLTGFRAYAADGTELTVVSAVIDGTSVVITTEEGTSPERITYAFDVSSTKRVISYDSLATNDGYDPQYITVMTGNLENGMSQPAIPFEASLSDVSIYDVSATSGKLNVEIRELGHLCSTYKVVVKINDVETEYTANFVTAGNFVINNIPVTAGDTVIVTLKSADGTNVISEKTITVE